MNRELNILGTLAMVLNDEIRAATNTLIGMSGETVAAIILLGPNPGLTVGKIAQALALTPSGAVRLIDRLAGDGLINREHGADLRTVTLELTPLGKERRVAALSERERIIRRSMRGLSAEEIATLGRLIDKILANLMTQPDENYRFCRMCDEDACEPHCPVEACWAKLVEASAEKGS